MRFHHGIMFQLVSAKYPCFPWGAVLVGSHTAPGTSGQAQPCAESEKVDLTPPLIPAERTRPAPPQAACACVCLCVCVGGTSVCAKLSGG